MPDDADSGQTVPRLHMGLAAATRLQPNPVDRRRTLARAVALRIPLLRGVVRRQQRLYAERDRLRSQHKLLRYLLEEERDRGDDSMAELRRLRHLELLASDAPDASDRLRYAIIVTYGRTGSTLLQGMISTTPGVQIRGENGGVAEYLWRYHRTAIGHRDRVSWDRMVSPRHPWSGIDGYPEDLAMRLMRGLLLETVLRPLPGTTLVGFKEVRWPANDLKDYLTFLQQVLPGCRFIFNTRDLDATAQSGWWARTPNSRQHLAELEQRLREGLAGCGNAVFPVQYEDYSNDPSTLQPLFEWLQIPFDIDRVRTVANVRHSY